MNYQDPLGDGKSRIELIDSMGNDLSIVNDARASFAKTSEKLDDRDIKLISYLIKHEHWSPFRGVVFKFKIKAPLYICRQWWKHVIASNHNEEQLGWNEKVRVVG
jgi:thymidylate synthase (FAD)